MKKLTLLFLIMLIPALIFAGGKQEKTKPTGPQTVTITVWARANNVEHWRADAAVEAAKLLNAELKKEGKNITVVVKADYSNPPWGEYKKKFTMAADAGEAPDIICSGHEDVPVWAQAGYIMPIANSISEVQNMYPEFADVIPSLWHSTEWHGKIWAVPQDTEARPMFFSKTKLKQLGWTDKQIAELPEKIKNGEFTLDDMIKTAQEAIKKGVVPPGYGYWHRPRKGGDFLQYYVSYGGYLYDPKQDKLVLVKDALKKWYEFQRRCVTSGITPKNFIGTEWKIWHDTVSHNKVLFWNGGIWQWADWKVNYLNGNEDFLFKNVGYALQPSGIRGKKGNTLSHPLVYMVTTEKASGHKYRDLVIRLLAKMTTKEINTKHAVESTHLGILKSQMHYKPYTDSKFLSSVTYMLNYNWYQPNNPSYSMWFDIVWNGMVAAENGEKTPQQAVDSVVKQMKLELGDSVIIK